MFFSRGRHYLNAERLARSHPRMPLSCRLIFVNLVFCLGWYRCRISAHAHKNHCSCRRRVCGQMASAPLYGEPQVAHYGVAGNKAVMLRRPMTLTIEPMINAGKKQVKHTGPDNWIAKTKDGRLIRTIRAQLLLVHRRWCRSTNSSTRRKHAFS